MPRVEGGEKFGLLRGELKFATVPADLEKAVRNGPRVVGSTTPHEFLTANQIAIFDGPLGYLAKTKN